MIIILILTLLIIFAINYNQCETFQCGNFQYENDNYMTLGKNYKNLPSCKKLNSNNIPKLTINKKNMNKYLKRLGYPVPKGFTLKYDKNTDIADLKKYMKLHDMKFPLIIKPIDGTNGIDVVSGIINIRDLYKNIQKYEKEILIEEQLDGIVYRILYVNKKLVAISSRTAPYIIGNGENTLQELINLYNDNLIKNNSKNFPPPVNNNILISQNVSLNDVIPKNRKIIINNILNYHGGAITENYPLYKIHPINRQLFETLLNTHFDSNCLGIDFISPDLSKPYYENGGTILEFNSNPARMLHDVNDPCFKNRYIKTLQLNTKKYI